MRKIRELLRLQAAGHSRRDIARSLAIAHSTVRDYLRRIEQAGLSWPLPPQWTDIELETRLFPPPVPSNVPPEEDEGHAAVALARIQTGPCRRLAVQPMTRRAAVSTIRRPMQLGQNERR
jgi:hypothetical protein